MPSQSGDGLKEFLAEVAGEEVLKVEEDLGCGFVRLKTSEAQRRQAAQDIRSTEDVVIETLRNSRDASASHIFVATSREGSLRTVVVIDDGIGVPSHMHDVAFLPRVTSKLDTAHLDRWGMHGRGMALYSIRENAESAEFVFSEQGRGSSIRVITDISKIGEKSDQSTFPKFEEVDGVQSMRGPKNILRTVAEFALSDKNIEVYCGTPVEIIATMWCYGRLTTPASTRVFKQGIDTIAIPQMPGMADDAEELASLAAQIGVSISARSARRILDGEIHPLPTMLDRMRNESFGLMKTEKAQPAPSSKQSSESSACASSGFTRTSVSQNDMNDFAKEAALAFNDLADKYYLDHVEPTVRQRGAKLILAFDLIDKNS